ncbi:MAG TPA: M56 family metallopeptidase [Longimicrobiales bacterium]|nr:M56 family metallopeptidase [Longimicrobiales bacterium]
MLCILYTIAVGTCLALAGWAVEFALPPRALRRWVWLSTITLSMAIPPLFRAKHALHVPITANTGDLSWWARVGVFDPYALRAWDWAELILLSWAVLAALALAHRVRRTRVAQSIVDDVPVTVTSDMGPATYGWLRPRIVLPLWVMQLPEQERSYVVRHEAEHLKSRDSSLLFITSLLLILTPWYLPLWWQVRRLAHAIELDCDERVIRSLGNSNRYAKLLLNAAQVPGYAVQMQPSFLGVKGSLERRLKALITPMSVRPFYRYCLVAIAVLALVLVMRTPHPLVMH